MKTAIIGYSGSGKSTLAQYIGKRSGAKVLHLDCVHWLPGWKERRPEEEVPIVRDFMAVSYTHLDVYKRQGMKCTLYDLGTSVGLILDYPGNPSRGTVCDALISQVDIFPTLCEPVSYTHLDVYKRQPHS